MNSVPSELRVVRSDGYVLRAFGPDDEEPLHEYFSDPETARWVAAPSDGDIRRWWQARNDWTDGTHAYWAVAAADDESELLGAVSLRKISFEQLDAEIGYSVQPTARRRGVATAAVRMAVGFAFNDLGLHRLQLLHAVGNHASCRVAEVTGFRLEGELRASYRIGDGPFLDEHLHARLDRD